MGNERKITDEEALRELFQDTIQDYICQLDMDMSQVSSKLFDWEFQELSYHKWAAYEILERIQQWPERDPLTIVYDFTIQMQSLDRYNSAHAFQYEAAYDAGCVIADEFNYLLQEMESIA